MKKNITFKKMALLFFSVSLPLFFLGFILIRQNSMGVNSRMLATIQDKVDQTAKDLGDIMDQLYHTAAEMAAQTNLKRLAGSAFYMTPYESAKNVLQIQEQQTSIRNASPYIENFVIYYANRLQAYNSKESGVPSFFEFTPEEYGELAGEHNSADFVTVHEQKLTEVVLPSFDKNFLIRIDLSTDALRELLEDVFSEYSNYYMLDMFEHEWQLGNLDKEEMAELSGAEGKVRIGDGKYYCFSAPVPYGDGRLSFFFSEEQLFRDVRAYQYLYLYFGMAVLLACAFFLSGSYAIIHKPIQTLVNAFQHINSQDYSVRISGRQNSDFLYVYQEFNHMAKELETLIEKNYQQQLLLSKAELKQLQAQINPHFLYNSFFLLRRMLQDELYEEAGQMADTLGLYFQYITRNSQDYMPLSREYRHAMLYCEIQQLRFGDRILIETDALPEKYNDILVPKLIIQPILENAFNYGLKDKVENGVLRVTVSGEESCLVIAIEDNGEELSDEQLRKMQKNLQDTARGGLPREMSGMLNIQRRLNIYFAEKAGTDVGGESGARPKGHETRTAGDGVGLPGECRSGIGGGDASQMNGEGTADRTIGDETAGLANDGGMPSGQAEGCLKASRSSLGGLCIRIFLPL